MQKPRGLDINHHRRQARYWLGESEDRMWSVSLGYTAFEIRLAVERICLQYYIKIVGSENVKMDLNVFGSFQGMKGRIFESAGNQREINRLFEITRALAKITELGVDYVTPDINTLSSIWHDCSSACHVE